MSTIYRIYIPQWPTSDGGYSGREIVREITGRVYKVNGIVVWIETITQVELVHYDAQGNILWKIVESNDGPSADH